MVSFEKRKVYRKRFKLKIQLLQRLPHQLQSHKLGRYRKVSCIKIYSWPCLPDPQDQGTGIFVHVSILPSDYHESEPLWLSKFNFMPRILR